LRKPAAERRQADARSLREQVIAHFAKWPSVWEELTLEERKDALRAVIDRVIVKSGGIESIVCRDGVFPDVVLTKTEGNGDEPVSRGRRYHTARHGDPWREERYQDDPFGKVVEYSVLRAGEQIGTVTHTE